MNLAPEHIVALVQNAGVIGAAGVGFPTHVKLQASVETVIVNGSESEPLLCTDKTILKTKALDVIEGLKIAMHAMGAKDGVIALNQNDRDVVAAVKKHLPASGIRIHLMGNYYPAGDELLTVYDVTKKIVPEGGNPLDVKVAVFNPLTMLQVYQAVNGKPATERMVTIAGEVKEPKVVTVPIGTRYSELIRLAGGSTLKEFTVLDGGPMMGSLVANLNAGIGKSTAAIVVLPSDHFIIRMKQKTVSETVALSKVASGQNALTTDLCPRHLLGHAIHPHETITALDYGMAEPSRHVTEAFLCSGCGICEMVGAETTFVSPKKIYGEYQRLLTKAKIKNPHVCAGFAVHSQFENRKLSIPMLVKKVNLGAYEARLPFDGIKEINSVQIPIQKHVGVKAQSTVRIGQLVRRGDVIALSPRDELGSVYHASIHGLVSEITDQFVEITGQTQ
jgi:Na+-translocating ferredoxin:NAD+ oxidoreductase RnfC subunit